MFGRDHQLPHTLVPLMLAVSLVRARLARGGSAATDPNALATFVASMVPVFEYWDDPARPPRVLPNASRDGVFREGGRELRFLDGRPTKQLLAVQAHDVDCVIEMLRCPERAVSIRNRVLRVLAKRLVGRSRELGARSVELRGTAERLLSTAHAWAPQR